jgi:hypothetical protein
MKRAKELDPTDALHFCDLTANEVRLICNGCGGKGSWINPPDGAFGEPCDWHDFEYWRGGTEADRKHSDFGFYTHMIEMANKSIWYMRPFMRLQAWTYYRAVRLFAQSFFHYGAPRGKKALAERLADNHKNQYP